MLVRFDDELSPLFLPRCADELEMVSRMVLLFKFAAQSLLALNPACLLFLCFCLGIGLSLVISTCGFLGEADHTMRWICSSASRS